MHRCRAHERVHALPQDVGIELLECCDDAAHLADRADTQVPPTAVRSKTAGRELYPDETLVRKYELVRRTQRRFSENTCIGGIPCDKIGGTDACVFLVANQSSYHFARQRFLLEPQYGVVSPDTFGGRWNLRFTISPILRRL